MSEDGDILLVAAGGGGDALAAAMLAETLGASVAALASFAWERKLFDPRPGPRAARDFYGLQRHGRHNWLVEADAHLHRGRSFLPRISAETTPPLFLLDPSRGAEGLHRQLAELAETHGVARTYLVDAGGDILARGTEPGLRSPLADALVLAAAAGLPGLSVFCLGLGLDGELNEAELRPLVEEPGEVESVTYLPGTIAGRYRDYFQWHPSEVTAMACLAALGYRGKVEMRADGVTVSLDPAAARIYRFDYERVRRRSLVAEAVADTSSFEQAVTEICSVCGQTELDFERRAARRWGGGRSSLDPDTLSQLEHKLIRYSEGAASRGVEYLTFRRVGEVLDLDGAGLSTFRSFLEDSGQQRFEPPLWSCRQAKPRWYRWGRP